MWASVLSIASPLAMRADPRRGEGEGVSSIRKGEASESASRPASAAAFEALYDEHFDFVWRSVRRLGMDEASVDDAVQDVFVVAFRRMADFEQRSSFKTWLFGISLRVVRSHRRTARRRPTDPLLAEPAAGGPGPLEGAERRQAVEVLDQILDQMDDDKRAVFVMAELEGLTAPEIAEATETKLNTVYSRLRAARKIFEDGVKRHRARDERRRA
ncbi:MAG: RNA polymerase sigma factor [Myxococcales bacterium]|nr:RNA polymerase sigma factor [Myxococcales bacterium]MCB9645718.1 RNA polymerase sigma factor [Deltaproteobacteria bacterium]